MSDITKFSLNDLELRFKQQYNRSEEVRLEAGQTLCEIWKRGTWKTKHSDFGKYVNDVLGITKPTAYQLIGTVDKSVGQYEKKEPVLKQIKDDVTPKTETGEFGMTESSPRKAPKEPEVIDAEFEAKDLADEYHIERKGADSVGVDQIATGKLAELFRTADARVHKVNLTLDAVTAALKEIPEDDPALISLSWNMYRRHIQEIKDDIKFRRPWAICCICGGDKGVKNSCLSCKDVGRNTAKELQGKTPEGMIKIQKGHKPRGWMQFHQWAGRQED